MIGESLIHWVDYLIIISSVVLAIGMGLWFARRQKSTDTYFTGSKSIPSWAIGISIFATLISSVTFIAYPGAAYGGNWILLVQGLMVLIVLIAMVGVVVPLFRRVIKLSTCEYFEKRFGFFARFYGALAFVLGHFSKMGTVFFLVSLAMAKFMGIDIYVIIITLGVAITLLTLLGGMEAVIWMDVVQGFLLILGGIICIGLLLYLPEGGPSTVFSVAKEYNKIDFGPYAWDLTQLTFLVMALNGIFYAVQKYGTDQTIVQRYLAAKTDKQAKKAAYIGVFLSVPIWTMFMFIGTGLFVYYATSGAGLLPEGIKADEVFPHFIATELPIGITGLIISALAAGAISSLDSDMNCLAAIGVEDFYVRFKPKSTDKQRLRLGRWLVTLAGVGSVGIAMLYAHWGGEGVLGVVFELYAIFSAGIVGLFLLGLFSRRANKQGLYVGVAAGVLFTAYAMLTSTKFDLGDGQTRVLVDLGSLNFTHHKYMLGVYSHIIVFVVGWLASYLFKTPLADNDLTIYGFWERRKREKLERKTDSAE